ncbi:MAG: hypothetical protein E7019_05005 [Alphaproteobacteria bacterium]|nr:hypothetical protein [Alphaproteobacteria bacterium]
MKYREQIKVFVAFFIGAIEICSAKQAYALFPALDTSSLVQGIEQTITAVKESTVVVNTMETVKKTSAAIGTAKKTVTEYVTDAKKELEETVKKVNEYKKQVEEYVEEVKEYKKKVEETIEDGKKTIEDGKKAIEDGKKAIKEGKEAVTKAKDTISESIEGVKSGIEAKTGITLDKSEATEDDAEQDITAEERVVLPTKKQPVIENKIPMPSSTRKTFDIRENKGALLNSETVIQRVIDNATIEAIKVKEEQKTIETDETVKIEKVRSKAQPINVKLQNVTKQPIKDKTPMVAPIRKQFTTSSVHHEEKLSFAFAITGLPDNGTNINGTVVIPKMLAMTCDLTSETALEEGKMDKCFSFLNDHRLQAQAGDPIDAPKVFNDALVYYSALNIAEAIKAINDSDSFEENFVEAIEFAPDNNAQDTYRNIVEMNKIIDMQMNTLLNMLSTNIIGDVIYNYKSNVYSSNKDFQPVYGDKIASDTGTGADGVMILPKSMAKACGMGSIEITDEAAVEECFNAIAGIKGDAVYTALKNEILRELNQKTIELALKIKSESGDFKDKQKEALEDNNGVQKFSAAAGGVAEENAGADIRGSQIDNIALSTMSAQNLLKIIELYSAKLNLDLMYNFYQNDAPGRRSLAKAKQKVEI